jgi:WD40 repeat protein
VACLDDRQNRFFQGHDDGLFYPSSWSPDGLWIAGVDGGADAITVSGELRSLDTTTNVSGVVLRFPAEFISGPALSPDGRTLYLNVIKPQGDIVIARMSTDVSRGRPDEGTV